jgi:N-acetyl-anhydromuramyl-L-alanine amidase AmpD
MENLIKRIGMTVMLLLLGACTAVTETTRIESENQNSRVRFVILHYTSEDFAESLRLLTLRTDRPVSSHYLVPEPNDATYTEKTLRVFQLVDESQRAWHAGRSYWRGKTGLNDQSIGIEIVNTSHCRLPDDGHNDVSAASSSLCFFPDYPESQLALVVELLQDILERHPDIPVTHVIGHSDIAPGRKIDPGPRFPWQRLYQLGIGAWYDEDTVFKYWTQFQTEPPSLSMVQQALEIYGYKVADTGELDEATADVLQSFQLHFRPEVVNRRPDIKTAAILFALIEKYYPRELDALLNDAE